MDGRNQKDGWMVRWMDGWNQIDGWMVRWMDGWMKWMEALVMDLPW